MSDAVAGELVLEGVAGVVVGLRLEADAARHGGEEDEEVHDLGELLVEIPGAGELGIGHSAPLGVGHPSEDYVLRL